MQFSTLRAAFLTLPMAPVIVPTQSQHILLPSSHLFFQ